MKPFVWSEDRSVQEAKEGAYWERNMLALLLATMDNEVKYECHLAGDATPFLSGWYPHQGEGFEGWSRVISLLQGKFTFHVPDDFDLGNLPQIPPNWDGSSTEQ